MKSAGMSLSCLPVSLYGEFGAGTLSLVDWFDLARDAGYDGADISVAHLDSLEEGYLHGLRDQAAARAIQVPMLVTYSDFTHPEAAQRDANWRRLQREIDAASCLGAQYVRLTAGQAYPGVTEAAGLAWIQEGLQKAGMHARDRGVHPLYENHVRGSVWTWNDFTQPVHRYKRVVAGLGHASQPLGLLFDTANNLALHDDPVELLGTCLAMTEAIHLADIQEPGSFRPVRLGEGVSPHRQILETVIQSGWQGWLSVEEASRNGAEGIRQARFYADQVWAEAGGAPRPRQPRIVTDNE